jgi:hypothetical protein
MVDAALVLGLGLLLTVVLGPDAAAQQIRDATLNDVPLMVELASRQDPNPSATAEHTSRLTTLLEQPDTLAVVSETEGRVTGGAVAARYATPWGPQEAAYVIEWLQVAENSAGTVQQALVLELLRQAAARGVPQIAIAAQPR